MSEVRDNPPSCPICGLALQVNGCHRGDGGAWVCNRPFRVVDQGGGRMLVEGGGIYGSSISGYGAGPATPPKFPWPELLARLPPQHKPEDGEPDHNQPARDRADDE